MKNLFFAIFAVFIPLLTLAISVSAQQFEINYDEPKVSQYTLPDVLLTSDGQRVADAETWLKKRRPEILELFREHIYGCSPNRPDMEINIENPDRSVIGGKATRKLVKIRFYKGDKEIHLDLLVYLPNNAKKPVPIFVGLNFRGNHSISDDPFVPLPKTKWFHNNAKAGYVDNSATEESRGCASSRWPVEMIIDRGFGLATAYYGDIDPDFDDGFKNGIHGLVESGGAEKRPADAGGSISAWAWGLSRIMDYFTFDEDIDQRRAVVVGHSRLGKTALWAGAQDERFAIVISNNSGCGGAALSRRNYGETLARMNHVFPHWNCENCKKYDNNEFAMPVDQHMLISLIAPRPVYIASATGDRWADPKGEFLAAKNAECVYRLFDKRGLEVDKMPPPDTPAGRTIGYHIRTGKHDITEFDWKQYLDFAEKHFSGAW